MKIISVRSSRNLIFSFLFLIILINSFAQNNISKSPNFIVILTDDQSWVGTSFLAEPGDQRSKSDYYQTPNMERMANK